MADTIEFVEDEETDIEAQQTEDVDADAHLTQSEFRVVYQTNNFFLPQIRDIIKNKEAINLRPEYQRRLRWTNLQKSRLIESLLLNIPVPPVFFYESDAARYEVMDGQQRLSSIYDFFSGDFSLTGLRVLTPLNGLRYTKCPPKVKRTLDRASISAIVLLMESKSESSSNGPAALSDIRRLVFDRLNTGGRKLNAQEIRNALNPGELNKALISISRMDTFTRVFGIPSYTDDDEENHYENPKRQKNALYSSMRDCELVLRFFALRRSRNIRGSMRSILDRAMEINFSEADAEVAIAEYKERFNFLYDLFDNKPFVIVSKYDSREKVSFALYDASMVAIDRLWNRKDDIKQDRSGVLKRLRAALADWEKYELIVGRRNTAEAVKGRIDLLEQIFLSA